MRSEILNKKKGLCWHHMEFMVCARSARKSDLQKYDLNGKVKIGLLKLHILVVHKKSLNELHEMEWKWNSLQFFAKRDKIDFTNGV